MGLFNWLFRQLCGQVFNQVDYNKDGKLEPLEIEIAILKIYNIINKRLPGWQNPPTRPQIQAALKVFDVDGNGYLDRWEFVAFASDLVHSGPDTFFARVGKEAAIRTAIVPGAAHLIQKLCAATGALGPVANAPLHIFAPAVGVVFGAIRGLIP
ncbi:g4239 [Coccomyxa elongata]